MAMRLERLIHRATRWTEAELNVVKKEGPTLLEDRQMFTMVAGLISDRANLSRLNPASRRHLRAVGEGVSRAVYRCLGPNADLADRLREKVQSNIRAEVGTTLPMRA